MSLHESHMLAPIFVFDNGIVIPNHWFSISKRPKRISEWLEGRGQRVALPCCVSRVQRPGRFEAGAKRSYDGARAAAKIRAAQQTVLSSGSRRFQVSEEWEVHRACEFFVPPMHLIKYNYSYS